MAITLPIALVVIELSEYTKAPVHVFDYELPIIEAIFGSQDDGLWQLVEEGEIVLDEFDSATAYEGVKARWGKYEGESFDLRSVYRDARDFARKIGADEPTDARLRSRALIVDNTKAPAAAKAGKAKKEAAAQ